MLALEGIVVLDLTRMAPGPFCTMVLGDLGAQVIRVEEPMVGRRARFEEVAHGIRGPQDERRLNAFNPLHRNKRSIALNLKHPQARRIFYRLAEGADVVVEGYRPGVAQRLGVDYEAVRQINPRVIYCSISGYGQDGPYRNLVGHDINYVSIAGALGMIGEKGRRPAIPMNLLADYAGGGMHATIAILAALIAREKTGRGQYLDIAMAEGVLYLLAMVVSDYFSRGVVPRRGEARLNGAAPYYNVYQTRDGKYLSIGCIEPWFWENLCRTLGREELIPHQMARGEKREEVFRALRQVFRSKTRDEWFDLLKDKDVAVGKVYALDEVFQDPQILHRGMVVQREGPEGERVRQVGIPVRLSETPGSIRSLGPVTGQHTQEILQELGYTEEGIEELRKEGAVQ